MLPMFLGLNAQKIRNWAEIEGVMALFKSLIHALTGFIFSFEKKIDAAAQRLSFSPTAIERYLKREDSVIFKTLWPGTIRHRLDGQKWNSKAISGAEESKATIQKGQSRVLKPYPEVIKLITTQLQGLQTAGLLVNVHNTRAIMLAAITSQVSHIMTKTLQQKSPFVCSEKFVQSFLKSRMNWTLRKATKAAKKVCEDWEDTCEKTFYRIVHLIIQYKIPVALLTNMDQTGIIFIPRANSTYHEKKASK